jgi:hypothetical protein
VSFLLSGPVVFFERDELEILVLEFSDRVRRDSMLFPMLSQLIGNRWEEAEAESEAFLASALFSDGRHEINLSALANAVHFLSVEAIERLADLLLESALKCLPLHSAALVSDVADELGSLLASVTRLDGPEKQKRLQDVHAKIAAGTLRNLV